MLPQDISPTVSTAAQTAICKGTDDDDDDDDDNNDDNNDNGDGMTSTTPTTRIPMMIRTLTIIASTSWILTMLPLRLSKTANIYKPAGTRSLHPPWTTPVIQSIIIVPKVPIRMTASSMVLCMMMIHISNMHTDMTTPHPQPCCHNQNTKANTLQWHTHTYIYHHLTCMIR